MKSNYAVAPGERRNESVGSEFFDPKEYPDFPWLAECLHNGVQHRQVTAASACRDMREIRSIRSLSVEDIKSLIGTQINRALQTLLSFTGMHMEYRAVCHDEGGHDVLSGLPIGEPVPTDVFQTMGVVFSAHGYEFAAWVQVMSRMFLMSHAARRLLKNRWENQTGYIWIDADHATITMYLPEPAVAEFHAAEMALEYQMFSPQAVDIMDWERMRSAIADRFMVTPDDVTVDFLYASDSEARIERMRETEFSAMMTIGNVPDGIAVDKARIKSLIDRLVEFSAENPPYDDDSLDFDDSPFDPDPFLQEMLGFTYDAGAESYDRIYLVFDHGKLEVLSLGHVVLKSGGVPLAVTYDWVIPELLPHENLFDGSYTCDMGGNVSPVPLSEMVDISRMPHEVYEPLADALIGAFRNTVLPKTRICLEKFLHDAERHVDPSRFADEEPVLVAAPPPVETVPEDPQVLAFRAKVDAAGDKRREAEAKIAQDFDRWRRDCRPV